MPVPDPVAFQIFGLDIMWYAIVICSGIIIATLICYLRAPAHGLASDTILTFVVVCIPAGIIGARLYYVLFHWDWYSGDLIDILNTRGGGLAIHGGLIAGLGAAAILCRLRNINVFNLLDLAAPSIALAQSIGRWGNYFNSEAHGGPTDLPWAITVEGQQVHPTFLYESIWCFLLFLFLLWFDHRRLKHVGIGQAAEARSNSSGSENNSDPLSGSLSRHCFHGQIILLYGILYSVERFFVEALRTDSLMAGPFKQAQLISLTVIAVCIAAYIYLRRRSDRA